MDLNHAIELHKKWLNDEPDGQMFDLRRADLSGADLSNANLRGADLSNANLRGADLRDADLRGADLRDADLRDANLRGANLRRANLRDADLSNANLRDANLRDANLRDANLRDADLSDANLSGTLGIMSPIDFMEENFQKTQKGLVVFKTFDNIYKINPNWNIAPGAIISETVNPSRCSNCGCGINVGTLGYVRDNNKKNLPIWKLLIRWEWLPGVVVPFNTDGKIRCERAELIEIVED